MSVKQIWQSWQKKKKKTDKIDRVWTQLSRLSFCTLTIPPWLQVHYAKNSFSYTFLISIQGHDSLYSTVLFIVLDSYSINYVDLWQSNLYTEWKPIRKWKTIQKSSLWHWGLICHITWKPNILTLLMSMNVKSTLLYVNTIQNADSWHLYIPEWWLKHAMFSN